MVVKNYPNKRVTHPGVVADIFSAILKAEAIEDREKEHFWICGLHSDNTIKVIELVSLGILNASLVHPREVFRLSITQGINSLILCHNHPSGQLEPSIEDRQITEILIKAGEIIGIEVRDHIVINNQGHYVSFKERGLI